MFISFFFLILPFIYSEIAPFRLGKVKTYSSLENGNHFPCLSPPFTFLAEGTQSYVFLSKDKTTVLKLFKNVENIENTFSAYKMANALPHLTGVINIHLDLEPMEHILLKDQWGRSHSLDPTHTPFILQKRADPFFKTIRNAPSKERIDLIQSFYALLKEMGELGIANLDDSLGHNYGFIDGKAVIIDFGKCEYAPSLVDQREAHMIRRLNKWLKKNQINSSVLRD